MSKQKTALHSVIRAAGKHQGARTTRHVKTTVGADLVAWTASKGEGVCRIREVTATQVSRYLSYRASGGESATPARQHKSDVSGARAAICNGERESRRKRKGCGPAAIANLLAIIRTLITADGGDPDAAGITRAALGLEQRSRMGKKEPMQQDEFENVVAEARRRGWAGLALALELERYLGLRGLESLRSISELSEFAREMTKAMQVIKSGTRVTDETMLDIAMRVVDGTKGGRPRYAWLLQAHVQATWRVIQQALTYAAAHRGFLLEGPGKNLKSARALYHRQCRQLGLTGKYAPHSLRYLYAVDLMMQLKSRGWTRKDILTRVAAALGHGGGRHRWVSTVYGRTVVHELPPAERHTKTLARLAGEMDDLAQKTMGRDEA